MQYFGTSRHQNGQTKAVTGASAIFTNAMSAHVTRFCLSATVDICFRQGPATGPALVALVTDTPVYASQPLYFTCNPGESVAVIARDGASTGTAYLQEAV
jgi:hypothetical protein